MLVVQKCIAISFIGRLWLWHPLAD
jgi:hypothetical protein